jgi:hypothetical protein
MPAQMDLANRALCFALRFPPKGVKRTPIDEIIKQKLVRKTDRTVPGPSAISEAALNFKKKKQTRGRKKGYRKTTKADDRQILRTFKKLRPPGHYVDSKLVHRALPKKIKKTITKRTVRRRLKEKGYVPERKINKRDPGPALCKKRLAWCKKQEKMTSDEWESGLQGVGDFKDFTWYPEQMRAKFKQLRAAWTYMKKDEKLKPAFVRPKRWFKQKEWKRVKKQKVFGLTTSNGKSLCFLVPSSPWNAEKWAGLVRTRVAPFLRKALPNQRSFQILLDGEKLLHAPASKTAMKDNKITTLPNWPPYSPDINPQENVWGWAEDELRKIEDTTDKSFETFGKSALKACRAYPGSKKLVRSMPKRVKQCILNDGGPIGC